MENKEFIYSQYIFIEYKSNKKEFYEIEINEINGIELLDNKKILKGELFREKIIKLTFKITKDFIKNIENNNKNSIIIQCSIKNMDKKIIIEINDQLIEEQEFKICYQIESEKEAKELNNITYKKIKKKLNIIYTGIIQDTTYYINYTNKKIDNSFDGDVEVMSFEPNEQEIKMIKKNNFDNNNGKIILIYGIINILDWFPITIKFNRIFNIWLDFYKNNNFEAKKKIVLDNFNDNFNELEDDLYSFDNFIFLIKKIDPNYIKELFNPLFQLLKEDKINKLMKSIDNLIEKKKSIKNQNDLDSLNIEKIIFLFHLQEIFINKYIELEKAKFKVDLINKFGNLNKYKDNCKLKYFILDKENENKYISQNNNNNIIKERKEFNIFYKIVENDIPVLLENKKIIKKKANNINNSKMSDSVGNDINIENYQFLQEIKSDQENNFDKLNIFFKNLIDEVLLLPLLIKGAINNNDTNTLDKCNNSFNYLYYIYSIFKEENHSLFAQKINKFKEYFINLCWT